MIKAKDLMIGDYINSSFGIAQVISIDKVGVTLINKDNGEFDIDFLDNDAWLQEILLTPEILEKNGFEFGYTASEEEFCNAVGCGYPEEKGWCYDEGAGEIKIIFPNETDGGLIRLDDQCADKHLELVFVKPIMVHELQHCLKLVGIKKDIEL